MKRWYKKDIKSMRGALDHAWLLTRPMVGMMGATAGALDGARERFVALDRAALVARHFSGFARMLEVRSQKQAEAAVSFVETRAYGDSTEELVERFEGLAAGTRKDIARLRALIERIKLEGLPAEVASYDPTRPL